jgi:thiazole synthase ThiGH ThiG subunit
MVFLRSVSRLLVTAKVVPSSPILVTLMKEAIRSSETPVITTATRRNMPKDGIRHSLRREDLKSYSQQ